MPPLTIHPEPAYWADGDLVRQATLRLASSDQTKIWFRIPRKFANLASQSAEPFAVAAAFLGMSRGQDVHVLASVSPTLLANLEKFARIWACWLPDRYRPIRFSAEQESAPTRSHARNGAVSTFSGGVDSCYTVLRHRRALAHRDALPLAAALMIHGFDIPLAHADSFARAAARAEKILASAQVPLLIVTTNYRQISPLPWEEVFAAGLASCLLLFQEQFSVGLIPASFSYHRLMLPYGSNPVTDPLLGSESLPIQHDGAELSRADKIHHLRAWPEAVAHLRVCWEGAAKDRNCGRCEKCVRTRLNFRVAGLPHPACFDGPLRDSEIHGLRVKGAQLQAMRNLLRSAQAAGIQDSWVAAVKSCISRNERIEALKRLLPLGLQTQVKRWFRWDNSQSRSRAA